MMTDSKETQALESIASAVDESQLKIILTTQCIKAQSLLVTKLRKQSEHQKEVCNFINNGNLKLETEIRVAEQKINSSVTALETIKSANIELQKDLFLSKERKSDITERVNNGIKKYENMWQEAKEKYENIPFIKHYIETKNQTNTIKQNIDNLVSESQKLMNEINEKKKQLAEQDTKQALQLANYFINERPKTLLLIQEKCVEIRELDKVIKDSNSENVINVITPKAILNQLEINVDIEKLNKNKDEADDMVLPKLELSHMDLDLLSDKLNKIKKSDSFSLPTKVSSIKERHLNKDTQKNNQNDYKTILLDHNLNTPKNYSKKKLINLIDDIKLNKDESKEILGKVNKNSLRDVDVTDVITAPNNKGNDAANTRTQEDQKMDTEEIDSSSKQCSVIGPPSQFLDMTEGTQEEKNDTIIEIDSSQISVKELDVSNKENNEDNMKDTEITKSGESDRSFEKIKDTILKKHKLDLSPQFVYSKKPMIQNTFQKSEVTSKFFEDNKVTRAQESIASNTPQIIEIEDTEHIEEPNAVAKSSKQKEVNIEPNDVMPISGFLFNHGADGVVQLSNTSLDTTVYGDGENDFPHCIDSSLLLSPKADLEVQDNNANDVQVLSQEVPNFLTGLRKGGFSFFGGTTPDEGTSSENSTKTQQSNFNFNFGGEEKKSRGGLFSMFR